MLPRFFIPDENMRERTRRARVPYEDWCREGLITATPGNVIDYAWIIDQIQRDAKDFDLQEIAFDRWGATLIYQQLSDLGLQVVEFGQGFASMSAPAKELEKLVLAGQLHPFQAPLAQGQEKIFPGTGDLPISQFHPQHLTSPLPVDTDRNQHRPAANRTRFPNLLITGIKNHIGERFLEPTLSKLQ